MKRIWSVLILMLIAAVGLSLISCGERKTETAADPRTPVADSVASADSVMIYYDRSGTGEKALVFVHGWSCDRSYWAEQVPAFNDQYTTVCIDLAGHGESGVNREDWSMAAYGADVAAVVNKLGLDEIIMIGHSMGGPVIAEAALLLPEQTVALVGVDTYHDMTGKLSDEQAQGFLAPFLADFVTATDGFVRSMFPATADSALVNKVAADMSAGDTIAALGSFHALLAFDEAAAIKEAGKPVRAVNADMWPVNFDGNAKATDDFQVTFMKGYGHFLFMENPDEFNTHLKTTIEEFWPVTPGY